MLPATQNETRPSSLVPGQICKRFSLDEIRSATQNFSESLVIGRGGFGKVYKGYINDGLLVAIKHSNSMSYQATPQFQAEVEMLSKVRHSNLVSLIGYGHEGNEMALIYEYMPHGTLDDHLHKAAAPLSWLQRLKICLGAARGLDYLHTGTGTRQSIIHRDIKSSNILLDDNYEAKLSDFGLAKVGPINQTRAHVSTTIKGTFGYMDPCYTYTGKLTRKSDVYAYGVVLLEVMCGRPAVDTSLAEWGLAPWAKDRLKDGKLNHIVDSRLKGQISKKCLKEFADIACRCLDNQRNQRPTMAEIVVKLELIICLQERLDSSSTKVKIIDRVLVFFLDKILLFFISAKVDSKARNLISAVSSGGEGNLIDKVCDKVDTPVCEDEPSEESFCSIFDKVRRERDSRTVEDIEKQSCNPFCDIKH